VGTDPSSTLVFTCISAADMGPCAAYARASHDACATVIGDGGAASACPGAQYGSTFAEQFLGIAKVACGGS
jgi:hypothetical protein